MPTYTLTPENDTYDNLTSTEVTNLSDSDDGTTVTVNRLNPGDAADKIIGFGVPTTPSGSLVSVVPGLRMKYVTSDSTSGIAYVQVGYRSSSGAFLWRSIASQGPTTALADYDWSAALGNILASGITDIGNVYARVYDNTGQSSIVLAKAWAKAYYLAAATVAAPSAPSGTTTSQTPVQTATVSSIVESWQSGWLCGHTVEMAVYHSSDVSGANPPAVPAAWSGSARITISTYGNGTDPTTGAVSMVCDEPLADGTYITFVRVSRDLPSGQGLNWSAWAKSASAWTVDTDPPTAPSAMTATANDNSGSVAISVTAPTTTGYENAATCQVQRSDDIGTTWADVSGMSAKAITLGGGATAMGSDYRAPAGRTTLQYRSRVTAKATSTGALVASAWKTITGVTGQAVFTGWRFIPIDVPTAAWSGAKVEAPLDESDARSIAVFEPLDSTSHKVVSSPSRGTSGHLVFWANGATDVAALESLLAQTGVILMTTAFGTTRFIAWSKAPSWKLMGTPSSPVKEATVEYVETDAP